MNERRRMAILLCVAILAYANTLRNGFTQDDALYILNNPQVTHFSVPQLFAPTSFNNVFRPMTFGSFALNWAAGGSHAFGYHFFNLLLHAIVAVLLYLTLRTLLEAVPEGAIAAWTAALLFAVHPIHTEAVASIVGRSELLAMSFLLGAWLLHMKDKPALSLVCFVLALMSKESAVVFVPLTIVGDYTRGKFKTLSRYAFIAGAAALYLVFLWKVQGGRFGEKGINFLDNPLAHLPARLRLLNALRITWKYFALQVFPARLSSDYSFNAIPLYSAWRFFLPAVAATIAVLGLSIWSLSAKRKHWALGGAIYLAGFAVTSNILIPTGTIMGERLAYLPSAGFCLLVALLCLRLENFQPRAGRALLLLLITALGVRTNFRNRDWRDNFHLFSADVKTTPGSAKLHSNLGLQYFLRGQLDAAAREAQTALSIYPDLPDAMSYYGVVESRKGNDQKARQILEKALSSITKDNPNFDFIAVSLAQVEIKLGADKDAMHVLDQDIEGSPNNSGAWSTRALIHYRQGDSASARADAEMAARLDPSNTQAQSLLGVLNRPSFFGP
jgi:protein O-mannosyl-transferase